MDSDNSSPVSVNLYHPPHPAKLAAVLSKVNNDTYHHRRASTTPIEDRTRSVSPQIETLEWWKERLAQQRNELEEEYSLEKVEDARWQINDPYYWKVEASHYCKALGRPKARRPQAIRESISNLRYWQVECLYYRSQAIQILSRETRRNVINIAKQEKKMTRRKQERMRHSQREAPISSRLRSSRASS